MTKPAALFPGVHLLDCFLDNPLPVNCKGLIRGETRSGKSMLLLAIAATFKANEIDVAVTSDELTPLAMGNKYFAAIAMYLTQSPNLSAIRNWPHPTYISNASERDWENAAPDVFFYDCPLRSSRRELIHKLLKTPDMGLWVATNERIETDPSYEFDFVVHIRSSVTFDITVNRYGKTGIATWEPV